MQEPTSYGVFGGGAAWLGDHGIVYARDEANDKLFISLPDNSTVEIQDVEDGDFGITLDARVANGFDGWSGLPRSNVANEHDFFAMPGQMFGTGTDHLANLSGRPNAFTFSEPTLRQTSRRKTG